MVNIVQCVNPTVFLKLSKSLVTYIDIVTMCFQTSFITDISHGQDKTLTNDNINSVDFKIGIELYDEIRSTGNFSNQQDNHVHSYKAAVIKADSRKTQIPFDWAYFYFMWPFNWTPLPETDFLSFKGRKPVTARKSRSCKHLVCLLLACITISANAELISDKTNVNKSEIRDSLKMSHQNKSSQMFSLHTDNLKMKEFISKIFVKYQEKSFLTVQNLEKLFDRVKSTAFASQSEKTSQWKSSSEHHEPHNATSGNADQTSSAPEAYIQNGKSQHLSNRSNRTEYCPSLDEILQLFHFDKLQKLGPIEFLHLSPVLLYLLDSCIITTEHAHENKTFHFSPGHDFIVHADHHDHHQHIHITNSSDPVSFQAPIKAWFFTFLSITIISVCCVVGAIVIPNMERVFYNHILQFLVALAVGAMSGDALLHLFPHALMSESHHADHHHRHDEESADHTHNDSDKGEWKIGQTPTHMAALYKGLIALMGMYAFFFLERFFTHFTKHRSMKKKKKRGSWAPGVNETTKMSMLSSTLESLNSNVASCDAVVMVVHPNKALKAYADVSHEALLHSCDESLIVSASGCDVATCRSAGSNVKYTIIGSVSEAVLSHQVGPQSVNHGDVTSGSNRSGISSGETQIAGFGDTDIETMVNTDNRPKTNDHCHSHKTRDFRNALSSVAMMVIIADIIFSFCSGLAIGTAYAGNTVGGISTSVAVFCHELPHEIGDLAVLTRSGLTMKRAICFNLLSTLPSFFGAIIGLLIGNLGSASVWIFAGAGGIFLYITLVNLVPEMTSVYTKSGEPWFLHLLLQAIGISVGTTLMLIISVSEESIITHSYTSGN